MRCRFNLAFLTVLFLFSAIFSACVKAPEKPPLVVPEIPAVPKVEVPPLAKADWKELEGWTRQDFLTVFNSFSQSCRALKNKSLWADLCKEELISRITTSAEAENFFKSRFEPYQVRNPDGSVVGLITGYYVPDLVGSRTPSKQYSYPLFRDPEDLLTIDLTDLYPELKGFRLKGRVKGKKVIPYWSREQIDGPGDPLKGNEIFWVEDPVELFFLHIQGSGRINLPGGEKVLVGYANQNGHPYRSIGKLLLESGEMTRDQMSMQNIRSWARKNPKKVGKLLNENPSYIFFHELSSSWLAPPGSLGIPLTSRYSLAVDPEFIPLGSPVFVTTTWPGTDYPLQRLMLAQDTGGAIKGPVRGDFFWGIGEEAGRFAGRMKQDVRFWVLLPR
jgi:membrane-bound lytic murein transglycosylase A